MRGIALGRLHNLDRLQLLLAGMLLTLGLMTVYSASAADFHKQLTSLDEAGLRSEVEAINRRVLGEIGIAPLPRWPIV